jgi:hypothetical protein
MSDGEAGEAGELIKIKRTHPMERKEHFIEVMRPRRPPKTFIASPCCPKEDRFKLSPF